MSFNLTTWDKIYKNYLKGGPAYASLGYEIYPPFKKFIKRSKFTSKSALDIGCGDGRYLKYLQTLGFATDGIDSSLSAVKMTKKLLKDKSRIIKADMFKYKIPPGKYDFIFSFNTLQHGKKAQIRKLVNRIFRALRNNGKTLITLPDCQQINEWHHFQKKRMVSAGTYIPLTGPEKGLPHSFFTKKEIARFFLKFKKVKIKMGNYGRWFIQAEK
ncbi:MAG: class I SAM-dependent methyltransferase [Patescibacteria group bacterium]